MRILVVEDEPKMAVLIVEVLREDGAIADLATTGTEALWMAESTAYEAIALDLNLPDVDGLEICRRLRAAEVWTPVLMLTARGQVADRVAGLDTGADDYLTKPFALDELLARLRALVRRGARERPAELVAGDLRLDPAAGRAWRGEQELALSAKEFVLLEAFLRRPGQVISRGELLALAWDHSYENRSNVVDVHLKRLREKVDRPFGVETLTTVRGRGYRLDPS